MASPQSKKRVQRLLKDHREWMVKSADFVRERGTKGAEEYLVGDPWPAVKVLPNKLGHLCVFFDIRGMTALFDGKSEGWSDVDRAGRGGGRRGGGRGADRRE